MTAPKPETVVCWWC